MTGQVPFEQAPPQDAGLFGCDPKPDTSLLTIIGVPWEPTASYGRGCSQTPKAIVPVSHQLDLFEPFLKRNFGHEVNLVSLQGPWASLNKEAIAKANPVLDYHGPLPENLKRDRDYINQLSADLNQALETQAKSLLATGSRVAVLGGDHSSPLGAIKACAQHFPEMGLLHVDAHHDLRHAYQGFQYSHASIMFNVLKETAFQGPLVSVGIRDYSDEEQAYAKQHPQVVTHYDRDLKRAQFDGQSWCHITAQILKPLPHQVYVSFDIDGLDPKLCPHTGTPVPGGLDFGQACHLLEAIVESGRQVIGFDLCEVSPGPSDWDLNVGARMLHKLSAITCFGL